MRRFAADAVRERELPSRTTVRQADSLTEDALIDQCGRSARAAAPTWRRRGRIDVDDHAGAGWAAGEIALDPAVDQYTGRADSRTISSDGAAEHHDRR